MYHVFSGNVPALLDLYLVFGRISVSLLRRSVLVQSEPAICTVKAVSKHGIRNYKFH